MSATPKPYPEEQEGVRAVAFSYLGVDYEIDLSAENAGKLDDALALFVGAGRRVGGRRTRQSPASSKEELAAIRQWARDRCYDVLPRGRVSQRIRDAYDAEN